jgi:hypothetical protein
MLLLTAALAGCGQPSGPAGAKPAGATPEIRWGEAVNGLQVGLAVKEAPAGPGSQTKLLLIVRNTGAKPVKIMKVAKIHTGMPPLRLEVSLDGKACHWLGPAVQPVPIMADDFMDLPPGGTDSYEEVFSPDLWSPKPQGGEPLRPPFKVQIVSRYAWQQASVEAGPWKAGEGGKLKPTVVDGIWTGEARSKPVEIRVDK